jgi:hypothetical protein
LAQLQQVERLEAREPPEVKPEQKKVYVIVTITYSYVPKSSRKSLNKKIKNE